MARAGYGNRIEGIHAVEAAARAGRVKSLRVERGRRDRPEIQEIVSLVGTDRVQLIDDARPVAHTEAPQGVVAECEPLHPVEIDSLATQSAALLVLDHLKDPQNVGAIVRSAAAAGCTGLIVSGKRAAPFSAAAFKASAGALERMPVAIVGSISEALQRLKSNGVWAVGLDAGADQSLFGLELLTEPVAMVIGAEGEGLSQLVSRRCDLVVSIPMVDETESLNASVSAALAIFEIMRARG